MAIPADLQQFFKCKMRKIYRDPGVDYVHSRIGFGRRYVQRVGESIDDVVHGFDPFPQVFLYLGI